MERRACGIMLYAIMGAREYLSSGRVRELICVTFLALSNSYGAGSFRNGFISEIPDGISVKRSAWGIILYEILTILECLWIGGLGN